MCPLGSAGSCLDADNPRGEPNISDLKLARSVLSYACLSGRFPVSGIARTVMNGSPRIVPLIMSHASRCGSVLLAHLAPKKATS